MSDDVKNRRPADRDRVNISEGWEMNYWCKQFGCTENQLRQAVSTVGEAASKVRVLLKNKSKPLTRRKMGC
jgi:hypothetical protein